MIIFQKHGNGINSFDKTSRHTRHDIDESETEKKVLRGAHPCKIARQKFSPRLNRA